jgi:hypothetical protein
LYNSFYNTSIVIIKWIVSGESSKDCGRHCQKGGIVPLLMSASPRPDLLHLWALEFMA